MELWRNILWNVQVYMVAEHVACINGMRNILTSQNVLGEEEEGKKKTEMHHPETVACHNIQNV